MGKERPLNAGQRRFVEEYLIDLNGKRAAQAAGYSAKNAASIGCQLLHNGRVAKAVREAMDARSRRTQITADRVLREYARIAFADIRKFTADGDAGATSLTAVAQLSDDDAAAVSELTGAPDGKRVRVKLHDKKQALDAIARHLGMFGKRVQNGESPAAAAERIRDLIRNRFARLIGEAE
jgi:phage terminase small subunit